MSGLFGSLRTAGRKLVAGYGDDELDLLADFFDRMAAIWTDQRQRLQRRPPARSRRTR